jgi:hypothetical protein
VSGQQGPAPALEPTHLERSQQRVDEPCMRHALARTDN